MFQNWPKEKCEQIPKIAEKKIDDLLTEWDLSKVTLRFFMHSEVIIVAKLKDGMRALQQMTTVELVSSSFIMVDF